MAEDIPVAKIRELYEGTKELAASDVTVVRNSGIHVLAALQQLLLQVDPDFCEHIIEHE